jgi:hypothetical protein
MQKKKSLILGLIILILGGIFLFDTYREKRREERAETFGKLFSFTENEVVKISLIKGEQPITVSKTDNTWIVNESNEWTADSIVVNRMIQTASRLQPVQLVSQNESKQSLYGVDVGSSVQVKLYNESEQLLAYFLAGNRGVLSGTSYVRLDGMNDVYLVNEILPDVYPIDIKKLRDKTILNLDENNLREIRMEQPKTTVVLMKGETAWSVQGIADPEVNQDEVKKVVDLTTSLTAEDFVEGKPIADSGFSSPRLRLSIGLSDNTSVQLILGKDEGQNTYVKVADREQIYLVRSTIVQPLFSKIEDYRKKAE